MDNSVETLWQSAYGELHPTSYPTDTDLSQLRTTRLANGRTLVVIVAIVTQIVVLAVTAVIMGVAVLTMTAVLGEVLVITAVATALERQFVTVADLAAFLEVTATLLITVVTISLAATGSSSVDGLTVGASKFT